MLKLSPDSTKEDEKGDSPNVENNYFWWEDVNKYKILSSFRLN